MAEDRRRKSAFRRAAVAALATASTGALLWLADSKGAFGWAVGPFRPVVFSAFFFVGATVPCRGLSTAENKWSVSGTAIGGLLGFMLAVPAFVLLARVAPFGERVLEETGWALPGFLLFMISIGAYSGARAFGALFAFGIPMLFGLLLFSGSDMVDRIRYLAPEWCHLLPHALFDLLEHYPASLAGSLLLVVSVYRSTARRIENPPITLAACFLPAYLASFEALNHLAWSMRGGAMSAEGDWLLGSLREMELSAFALLDALAVGGAASHALGHRSGSGLPLVPLGAVGALLGVALNWWLLWDVFGWNWVGP